MAKFGFRAEYVHSVKWGTVSVGISFLKQLLLVPAFILSIGGHGYAFWLSVTALITLINGLNSGHLHYSANLLSIVYHKTGVIDHEIKQFQGASLIYSFLQLLLGAVLFFPPVLAAVTSFNTGYILDNNLHIAFLLMLIGRIIYQYFSSFLIRLFEPIGDIHISLKYRAIADFFELAATGSVIYLTGSILYTAIAIFIISLFFSVLNYISLKKRIPFQLKLWQKIDFKDAFGLIKSSFVLNASFWVEKIYEVGLNLVIVRFFGTTTLNIFSTSRVMTNMFYRITNVLILPAFPEIQKQFALQNLGYILNKVRLFWRVSVPVIVISVTIGIPLLPYIYSFWTKNELRFDFHVVGFLLVAMTFQSFGTIINELLKKTNFSQQLLTYNALKLVVTVLLLMFFGYYSVFQGVGIALAAGEALSLIYLLYCFSTMFKDALKPREILYNILPSMLFCMSVILLIFSGNYMVLVGCNIPLILFFGYKEYLKPTRW